MKNTLNFEIYMYCKTKVRSQWFSSSKNKNLMIYRLWCTWCAFWEIISHQVCQG